MKDPYKVLGLPEGTDYDTAFAKYSELKQIYGEQRFCAGEEGNEGAAKLNELESAWAIIREEKLRRDEDELYGTGYESIENLVKSGNIDKAQERLDRIEPRDAEWHYHQALIYYKRDWINDSHIHLKEAVRLDPGNRKYSDALERMEMNIGNQQTPPEKLGMPVKGETATTGNCLSNCCTTLCCLECLSLPMRYCGGCS